MEQLRLSKISIRWLFLSRGSLLALPPLTSGRSVNQPHSDSPALPMHIVHLAAGGKHHLWCQVHSGTCLGLNILHGRESQHFQSLASCITKAERAPRHVLGDTKAQGQQTKGTALKQQSCAGFCIQCVLPQSGPESPSRISLPE